SDYCVLRCCLFSSRRRHTRLVSDWSSDVCSSDLMWSRVGGDAIDLALLGAAFRQMRPKRNKLTMATAAVAGVTALGAAFRRRRQIGRASCRERGESARVAGLVRE